MIIQGAMLKASTVEASCALYRYMFLSGLEHPGVTAYDEACFIFILFTVWSCRISSKSVVQCNISIKSSDLSALSQYILSQKYSYHVLVEAVPVPVQKYAFQYYQFSKYSYTALLPWRCVLICWYARSHGTVCPIECRLCHGKRGRNISSRWLNIGLLHIPCEVTPVAHYCHFFVGHPVACKCHFSKRDVPRLK